MIVMVMLFFGSWVLLIFWIEVLVLLFLFLLIIRVLNVMILVLLVFVLVLLGEELVEIWLIGYV